MLPVSDQTGVPLDHNAVQGSRRLHDTIWKKLNEEEIEKIKPLNFEHLSLYGYQSELCSLSDDVMKQADGGLST